MNFTTGLSWCWERLLQAIKAKYIMLLKIYCSFFHLLYLVRLTEVADGPPLTKTKMNRLINSTCYQVRSIKSKGTH